MRRSVIAAIVSGQLCAFCGAAHSGVVDSIPGLRLWLDAEAITGLDDGDPVTIWADSSGHDNRAVEMLGIPVPTYVASVAGLNNNPAVRFAVGSGGALEFEDVANIGTVLCVLRKHTNAVNMYNSFLTDDNTTTLSADWMGMIATPNSSPFYEPGIWKGMSWPPEYDPAPNLRTGTKPTPRQKVTQLNGVAVDGPVTPLPRVYSVLAIVPAQKVEASRIGSRSSGSTWEGDLAEIIIYDRELSQQEMCDVGFYLAEKYGLAGTGYGGVMGWDGTQNDWGTAHWTAANPPPPPGTDFPNQWIHAVIENPGGMAVCSVAEADRSAASLTMIGGTDAANSNRLAIAANRTLTVAGRLDAGADWNYVTLGDNARLRFGQIGTVNSSIWALEIEGDATVESIGNAPVASFHDTWEQGMPQRTFVKQGGGILKMVNSHDTIVAGHTAFRVEEGTLRLGGADPLGGSTAPIQLAGGTVAIEAPVTGYLPGLNQGWVRSYYNMTEPNPLNLPRDPLGPSMTETAEFPPWTEHTTFVYSGEMFVPDDGDGTGTVSFYENIDDSAYLVVDGRVVLNNLGWADQSAGTATLRSGWRSFELRVSNGNGPGGLSGSPPFSTLGFGYVRADTNGEPDPKLYSHPQNSDQSTMDVFRAPVLRTIDMAGTDFVVSAPGSGLNAYSPGKTAAFGSVTMLDGGELTTAGTVEKITFTATTIASNATAVGFGPDVPTDYGGIDAQGADVAIYKVGQGTWAPQTAPSNLGPQAAWGIKQGTLRLVGTQPWGTTRSVMLVGGTLVVSDQPQEGGPPTLPEIPGLQLHLDASGLEGLQDGDRVSPWDDLSGNDRHFVQPQSARQPTYISGGLNGRPVVRFDPGAKSSQGDRMELSGQQWMAQEVFAVVSMESDALEYCALLHDFIRRREAENKYLGTDGSFRINDQATLYFAFSQAHIIEASRFASQAYQTLWLGDYTSQHSGYFWKGDVAEVLVYDGVLNEKDRNLVGHYLEEKYGLDTGYRGLVLPLTMTEYDFVVDAGIGWDGSPLACTLHAETDFSAQFGVLTLKNGILTTKGAPDGISFTGTTIDARAGAAVGIAPETPTDLGAIDVVQATPVTFSQSGPADLVLTSANRGTGWGSHVSVDVAAGRLVLVHDGSNPVEDAALQVGGGELILANNGPDNPAHFDNPLRVTADGTVTAGTGGLGLGGAASVRLGSAGSAVTVDGAILTLRTADGYSLEVAGPVNADGTVRVAQGTVTFAGGGNIHRAVARGGQFNLDTDLSVGQMTVKPGAGVNTGANQLEVTDRLRLASATFTVSEGHSFLANGADLASQTEPRTLTLQGGTVSIGFPLEPFTPLQVLDSIGINFASERQALAVGEVAGAPSVAQDHWNNLPGVSGKDTPLVNRNGVSPPGNPAVSWWAGRTWRIGTTGSPDEKLFYGYLEGGPTVVALSDIPYEKYDVYAYIGSGYTTDAGGSISTGAEALFFKGEGKRTGQFVYLPVDLFAESIDDVPDGRHSNYAVFSGLSGDTTLTLTGLTSPPTVTLFGLQIVESLRTDDADLSNTNLLVTADTTLDTGTTGVAALGDLALEEGSTLILAPSGTAGISVGDLSGSGTVAGHVLVRDVLDPGGSVGTLNVTDLTMQDGSTYHWELGGSAADLVLAGGLALPLGGWSLKLIDGGATSVDGDVVLFRYTSLADNSLGTCTIDTSEVSRWSFADGGPRLYNDAENQRVLLTGVAAVPEPGTLLLLASGTLGLLLLLRRRPKGAALRGQ